MCVDAAVARIVQLTVFTSVVTKMHIVRYFRHLPAYENIGRAKPVVQLTVPILVFLQVRTRSIVETPTDTAVATCVPTKIFGICT